VKKAFAVIGDDEHLFQLSVADSIFGGVPGLSSPLASYEGGLIPSPRFERQGAFALRLQ
jgi:hypothetical protein